MRKIIIFFIGVLLFSQDHIFAKVAQKLTNCDSKACGSDCDTKNKSLTINNQNNNDFKVVPGQNEGRKQIGKGVTLFPIDRVVVIIDGPERRHLICQSELERMGIDGRRPTINDLIIEELIYQDAIKLKIPIDDYADRYIRSIKKAHNIGDRDVDRIFESAGLSPEEGRIKLQKMGANSTMIDIKVKARIFIPQHDVEDFFNKNPKYKQAKYQLEVAFVPFFFEGSHQTTRTIGLFNRSI
jgi:hypothetical protein